MTNSVDVVSQVHVDCAIKEGREGRGLFASVCGFLYYLGQEVGENSFSFVFFFFVFFFIGGKGEMK